MVAQTMTVFQQKQVRVPQAPRFDGPSVGEGVITWQAHYKGILKQDSGLDCSTIIGECEQEHIELDSM